MSDRDALGLQPGRNAFGDLIVEPDQMSQRERVEVTLAAAGAAMSSKSRDLQWLGRAIHEWLQGVRQGTLEQALGIAPGLCSPITAQSIMAQKERDSALLELSVAAGGDRAALRILSGQDPCPKRCADLVESLRAKSGTRSIAAFTRARNSGKGVSRHP